MKIRWSNWIAKKPQPDLGNWQLWLQTTEKESHPTKWQVFLKHFPFWSQGLSSLAGKLQESESVSRLLNRWSKHLVVRYKWIPVRVALRFNFPWRLPLVNRWHHSKQISQSRKICNLWGIWLGTIVKVANLKTPTSSEEPHFVTIARPVMICQVTVKKLDLFWESVPVRVTTIKWCFKRSLIDPFQWLTIERLMRSNRRACLWLRLQKPTSLKLWRNQRKLNL